MRNLTKKQKNFLDKWIIEHKNDVGVAIDAVALMSLEDWEVLQKMNDTEILYYAVNNYVAEKV